MSKKGGDEYVYECMGRQGMDGRKTKEEVRCGRGEGRKDQHV